MQMFPFLAKNVIMVHIYVCYEIPGVTQSNNEASGKLGTIQKVGNLWRIRLNADKQTGTWQINIKSTQPYTLKITGQIWLISWLLVYTLDLQFQGIVQLIGKYTYFHSYWELDEKALTQYISVKYKATTSSWLAKLSKILETAKTPARLYLTVVTMRLEAPSRDFRKLLFVPKI